MPPMLYVGPTTDRTLGTPSQNPHLNAAREFVDVLRISPAGRQDRLDFLAKHAGNVPMAVRLGAFANPDSSMYRYSKPWFSTQADRGRHYEKTVAELLNVNGSRTDIRSFVELQWWEFADNWLEKTNWGLVALSVGKDGCPALGEERDYGDFLTAVGRASFSSLGYLSRETATQ